MAEASNPDQSYSFDADFKDDFNQGMLRMLSEGSSNDVRIILSDGEIMANKDVLAAQCVYFAANFRFKEQTQNDLDHIDITECSKEVMERIIKYLFTGSIKFKDLGLLQLLELINQVRAMLLKGDLQALVEAYIKDDMLTFDTRDIVCGLKYLDRFPIDSVNVFLMGGLLVRLPAIAQDDEAISAFSTLSFNIVKEFCYLNSLFRVYKEITEMTNNNPTSYQSAIFRCVLAWFNQNKDLCQEDRKQILDMIALDSLPAADLFRLVKPSGLFPDDEVDKRIIECLLERDELKKNHYAN